MNPEKRRLIHDVLEDSDDSLRREATLLSGRRLLRYKRLKRAAIRCLAVMCVFAIATLALYKQAAPHPRQLPAAAAPTSTVNYVTDDQLLALFTNTPVGLAKVGDKAILIFPRAGDKERFVGRF